LRKSPSGIRGLGAALQLSKSLLLAPPAVVCVAVLCVLLSLGLWPFHVPQNEVSWLEARNGIHIGRHGSLVSAGEFPAAADPTEGVTVEVWLQPRRAWDSGTFLAFSTSGDLLRLRLRQSQRDLQVLRGRAEDLEVEDVFPRKGPTFLTLTSGAGGTRIYANGRLFATRPQSRLRATDLSGRLIVADAAGQTDSWAGQLFALALYSREFTSAEVEQNFAGWTGSGYPKAPLGRALALYAFDEHSGRTVHNKGPSGVGLKIPETYKVVDQIFLEPVWSEFSMSQSYWSAALKNIVGFVPLGFCLFGYFTARRRVSRPTLVTLLLGTAVSLTIEVLQVFIPTRDSGTTDLFTNTLGTWIGIVLYERVASLLRRADRHLT
jgi:VanZ family protein